MYLELYQFKKITLITTSNKIKLRIFRINNLAI